MIHKYILIGRYGFINLNLNLSQWSTPYISVIINKGNVTYNSPKIGMFEIGILCFYFGIGYSINIK